MSCHPGGDWEGEPKVQSQAYKDIWVGGYLSSSPMIMAQICSHPTTPKIFKDQVFFSCSVTSHQSGLIVSWVFGWAILSWAAVAWCVDPGWMVRSCWRNRPPRPWTPLRNRGLIASLFKGKQWFRSPDHKALFVGWYLRVRLTSHNTTKSLEYGRKWHCCVCIEL